MLEFHSALQIIEDSSLRAEVKKELFEFAEQSALATQPLHGHKEQQQEEGLLSAWRSNDQAAFEMMLKHSNNAALLLRIHATMSAEPGHHWWKQKTVDRVTELYKR